MGCYEARVRGHRSFQRRPEYRGPSVGPAGPALSPGLPIPRAHLNGPRHRDDLVSCHEFSITVHKVAEFEGYCARVWEATRCSRPYSPTANFERRTDIEHTPVAPSQGSDRRRCLDARLRTHVLLGIRHRDLQPPDRGGGAVRMGRARVGRLILAPLAGECWASCRNLAVLPRVLSRRRCGRHPCAAHGAANRPPVDHGRSSARWRSLPGSSHRSGSSGR